MNRRDFLMYGLSAAAVAAGGGAWFINQPKFGRLPTGERLRRIQESPHYVNGQFQCLEPVEVISGGNNGRIAATLEFAFRDKSALMPKQPVVSCKTDLKKLSPSDDVVIWMGHSTYYMQLGGKRILIDPVFSSYASPVFFINKAFPGSNIYGAEDFPTLDVLAISHDHWDHLDYASIMALAISIKEIVCPLGVGEYFEEWGFDPEKIHEEDWYTEIKLFDNLSVHILPSQHFSGRFIYQNPTEWCGFAFVTPKRRVFVSGDGGFGAHFVNIGRLFGGFDLAIMENGQYNERWSRIHMMPRETAQAAADVGAKTLLTSHNGKFALSLHTWDEPYREMTMLTKGKPYEWLTPKIGELVYIGKSGQHFDEWWNEME